MHGIGQLLGFIFIVIPVIVWNVLTGKGKKPPDQK